jgi:hypothetical protein
MSMASGFNFGAVDELNDDRDSADRRAGIQGKEGCRGSRVIRHAGEVGSGKAMYVTGEKLALM